MTKTTTGRFSVAALLLTGCVGAAGSQEDSEGDVGSAGSRLLTMNALTMNALTMNALTMSALTLSALTINALTPSNLGAIQAPSTAGDLARLFLQYTVSCAFDPTQSFGFTWTDGSSGVHNEIYWGGLGLATSWSTTQLSTSDQEWISACLLSRVNWYGTSVTLSARGDGVLNVTDPVELGAYTQEEGAFWGNLFAASPSAYSCNHAPNDSYSRSLLRDCAAGHLDAPNSLVDCGLIQRVGPCDIHCKNPKKNGDYYPRCQDSTGTSDTKAVVTVFLP